MMEVRRSLAVLALLVAGAAFARPPAATADPFVPADDSEVLERLPVSPLDPEARRIQALRAELTRQPDDLALAARLAWVYIETGRALSDPRYYGYAQGALAPWWAVADAPVPVLVLRATSRQRDHHFASALHDLSAAVRADPRNAQAWLTQATVCRCRASMRRPDAVASKCCGSPVRWSPSPVSAAWRA
jgi:Flp pilus assembly protein TadD